MISKTLQDQYPSVTSTGFNNSSPQINLGKFSLTKNSVASCMKVLVWSMLCGLTSTFSISHNSFERGSGSSEKTSKAAPLSCPLLSAAINAFSSTRKSHNVTKSEYEHDYDKFGWLFPFVPTGPRPKLINTAFCFTDLKESASTMPRVSMVEGAEQTM